MYVYKRPLTLAVFTRGRDAIVHCRQMRSLQSCFLVTFGAGTNPKGSWG